MSNKKNSPVVESTVVKGNSTVTDNKNASTQTNNNETSTKAGIEDNNAHYDSIAELKKATAIVDADGNPVDDNSKSAQNDEQAQKKAKIREDLVDESNMSESEDLMILQLNLIQRISRLKAAKKTAVKMTTKTMMQRLKSRVLHPKRIPL